MHADLKALEFEAIRRLLEKLTRTPFGADAARHLEPAPDLGSAQRMLEAVTAMRTALDAGDAPAIAESPEIRPALRQAAQPGSALSGMALRNLRQVMTACAALQPAVAARPAMYPGPCIHLLPPPDLLALLDRSIHISGRVRDDASPRLVELHAQSRTLREQVTAALKTRMQADDVRAAMTGDRIVWQGARGLLSVPSSHADRIKGVRRGGASSGRDQLVEPMEAVADNNRLETLSGQQDMENQQVLRDVTEVVRRHLPALEDMLGALTWIDLALAAGQLSVHLNAHAPTLVAEPRVLLDGAYHPALLLQFAQQQGPQPVPLSIMLDAGQPMLVITGPNTGGKTVVLKTVGLLTVMAHCGLHIPADGDCVIGSFSRVIVDIGDPQNLYHHLSTFAGHVETLKRLLAEADAGTLVLLDELGTGTDPEEGAALAMAVLDELTRRKVHGVVTTHLSPLKDFAGQHPRLANASMQFDFEHLKPTYRLQIGSSGRSLGLLIARRNGLPGELVDRAQEHLQTIAPRHQDVD